MDRAKEERMPEIYCLGVHPLSPRVAHVDQGPGGGGGVEVRRQEEGEKRGVEGRRKHRGRAGRPKKKAKRRRRRRRRKGGGSDGEGRKRRMKLRSSRIPPFIWLCDEEQARPARQKISKIRRVARGTVCPGAPSRIYKERSHDLCRGLGYLSISMVHAIPLHGYRYVLASNARSPGSFLFFFFFFSSPSFPLSFLSIFPTGFRVLSGNVKFSTLHFLKKGKKSRKHVLSTPTTEHGDRWKFMLSGKRKPAAVV